MHLLVLDSHKQILLVIFLKTMMSLYLKSEELLIHSILRKDVLEKTYFFSSTLFLYGHCFGGIQVSYIADWIVKINNLRRLRGSKEVSLKGLILTDPLLNLETQGG